MDELLRLLDPEVLGIIRPAALVVIIAVTEALKQVDKHQYVASGKAQGERRKDNHGTARRWYALFPYGVAAAWFLLRRWGDPASELVLLIGIHGAVAGSGYKIAKGVVEAVKSRR